VSIGQQQDEAALSDLAPSHQRNFAAAGRRILTPFCIHLEIKVVLQLQPLFFSFVKLFDLCNGFVGSPTEFLK
jgi:hypothetical protein